MGLFAKSRPDTQRMLTKGKGNNKASLSQILQLRNSSSSSSYDDDDADITAPPTQAIINHTDHGKNQKGNKKKKVWRVLQEDSMPSTSNAYIPPGIPVITAPIDPFSTTTTSASLATNTSLYNQPVLPSSHIVSKNKSTTSSSNGSTTTATTATTTKLFAKKKFQRLDSTDDASYENIRRGSSVTQKFSQTIQPPSLEPLIPSVSKHTKESAKSTIARGKPSSIKKNKNSLSKHIQQPLSFSKINSDDTPRSSSVSGDVIYYPPPTMPLVPTKMANTKVEANTTGTDFTTSHDMPYPSKDFIMNVIRSSNSTGEEMFDIRSESTGSGNIHIHRISNENGNPSLQRCTSIGSESDVYSQSVQDSICFSDTGYPVSTKPSNSFQQMIFDDKFQKLTAVTQSETGSNTYNELAKAATRLTKVLSPEPKQFVAERTNTVIPPPPPPHPPFQTNIGNVAKSVCKSSTKLNMQSTQSIKMKHTLHSEHLRSLHESVDAMSCTSTHSGKSRGDYRAAIRAKVRSPIKDDHRVHASTTATTATMNNLGPNATGTPISVANATFSNSVRLSDNRSDFSFEPKANTKNSTSKDPFMLASDFNVTKFTSKEDIGMDDDPFQIGTDVIGSGSHDSAWDVTNNSFPYLGSSSASGGDSQNSHVSDNKATHHHQQQHQYTDEVGKANSMDDALIESIRNSAYIKNSNIPTGRQEQRDPSPQEVRISHSDGDLDFSAPPETFRGNGVGRVGDYYYSGPNMQQLKKKTATKGVPANAIIGSMLFRQTQTCDEYCNEDELAKNTKKNSSQSVKKDKWKESPKSGGRVDIDHRDETESHSMSHYKVPRHVHTECSKSDVSSVTEEASSFYTKNLMQHKWNQPAQSILNHYNVQRGNKMRMATTTTTMLQSRDMNAAVSTTR